MRRWRDEQTEGFCNPKAECKAMQLNSFNHLSSLYLWKHTEGQIDSQCVWELCSLPIPPSPLLRLGHLSIDGWKRMSDMRRRSQSATLTNFSLVSELGESWQEDAWSVSVSCPEVQNSQCGCYYSKNTGSYGCYKMLQNPHNIWVCAHIKTNDSVIVLDKQSLRTINKCSSSRYSSLPLRQTTCSFLLYLDFYFSALCQVNPSIFRFLCLSPCLSPFHPPPTCLLYCSAL